MGRASVVVASCEAVLAAGATFGCWLSYDSNIGTGNTAFHPWFYTFDTAPSAPTSVVLEPALWATSYLSASAACASVLAVALHAFGADAARPWLHYAAAGAQVTVLALSIAAWAWYIPNLGWLSALYGFSAAYQYGFWLEVATSVAAAVATLSAVKDARRSCEQARARPAAPKSSSFLVAASAVTAWAVLALSLIALFGSWFKGDIYAQPLGAGTGVTYTFSNFLRCSSEGGCYASEGFNDIAVATQITATALAFVAALLVSAAVLSPDNKGRLVCYAVTTALYILVAIAPPVYWVASGRYTPQQGANGYYKFDYALYCAASGILAAILALVIVGVALCRLSARPLDKARPLDSDVEQVKELSEGPAMPGAVTAV
jgi:hypothetical protein